MLLKLARVQTKLAEMRQQRKREVQQFMMERMQEASEEKSSKETKAEENRKEESEKKDTFSPFKSSTPKNQSPRSLSPIPIQSSRLDGQQQVSENQIARTQELVQQHAELANEQERLKDLIKQHEEMLREKQAQIEMQQRMHRERLDRLNSEPMTPMPMPMPSQDEMLANMMRMLMLKNEPSRDVLLSNAINSLPSQLNTNSIEYFNCLVGSTEPNRSLECFNRHLLNQNEPKSKSSTASSTSSLSCSSRNKLPTQSLNQSLKQENDDSILFDLIETTSELQRTSRQKQNNLHHQKSNQAAIRAGNYENQLIEEIFFLN